MSENALDVAIMGHVKEGVFEAPDVVERLKLHDDWPDMVTAMAEDLALARAQVLIRSYRRSMEAEAARKSSVTVTESSGRTRQMRTGRILASDIAKAPVYIPGTGHKAYSACTAADFRARAEMYEKLAGKATARAEWCHQVASLMERKKVSTFGKLGKSEIPALPDGDALDDVMDGAA